jgi:hypothetical protein
MSKLIVLLPRGLRITIAPRRWLAAALCAVLALLVWSFVAVLQQGIERGNRLRAEQLRAATQPRPKPQRAAPVKTAKAEQPS